MPATYGGFETSVEETSRRFVNKGIKTDIYCRSNHYKNKLNVHNPAVPNLDVVSVQIKK